MSLLTLFKVYGGWMALVSAFGLAYGLYQSEINAAEARGQAELMAHQADSAMAAMEDSLPIWAAREMAANERASAIQGDLDSLKALMGVNRERDAQAILAAYSVIERLTDSLGTLTAGDLAAIAGGMESLQEANRLCNDALGRCDELVRVSDARMWDLQEQGRKKDAVMHQQTATIDRLQNLRGSKVGTLGWLGWSAAAVATVLLVVR